MPHCIHKPEDSDGCEVAEHAERNAIAWAARLGLALEGTELHVTHAPCLACARSVINAGIVKVSYDIPYRLTEGVELLTTAGIEVVSQPF
jgi:dCMP deaminase